MIFQSELPRAIEPSAPHFLTSWFVNGGVSSSFVCLCWVKIIGCEWVLKWWWRALIFEIAGFAMLAKKFWTSIMRRAVFMFALCFRDLIRYSGFDSS